VAELVVAAASFGDPAAVQHHDLVDLVEPVGLVAGETRRRGLRWPFLAP
jgi:hypothetical protein